MLLCLWATTISTGVFAQKYKGLYEVYVGEDDTSTILADLDDKQHFAVKVNTKKLTVRFLKQYKGNWKTIGGKQFNEDKDLWDIGFIWFDDLNGDCIDEILVQTHPNMNGNRWMQVFAYVPKKDSILYAGELVIGFEVDTKNKRILVEYEGSSYMEHYKEIKKWIGYKLVTEKKLVIPEENYEPPRLELYSRKNGKLRLISSEKYDPDNPEQKKLWDDFFK